MDFPAAKVSHCEPLPRASPNYDTTLDHAPFETLEQYYPCPPACISRNLMTEDIAGAQGNVSIQDPKDPMCLNKPYPEVWLIKPEFKSAKERCTLQTNRHTNPLDPDYQLPSGPNLIPSGEKKFSNRTYSMMLDCSDIPGTHAESLYKNPCRCLQPGEHVEEIKGSKPKIWTWLRKRTYWGHNLDLYDINIGKKQIGFIRARESDPLEPLYPTEPVETPEMKYKRLKFRKLPPHKKKSNVAERILDNMYWRAEQLPNMCRHWGQPQPTVNSIVKAGSALYPFIAIIGKAYDWHMMDFGLDLVTYDAFRYSLEQFGFYCDDGEFKKLLKFADPDNLGSVKYENFSRALKHCDGLELDVPRPLGFDMGFWGSPSCLGQGVGVIEPLARYGKSVVSWSENQQLYSPLTGMPVPKTGGAQVPLDGNGFSKGSFRYNYLEVLGRLQNEDRKKHQQQYEFYPTPPLPKKKLPVMPPVPVHRVSLASADTVPRPSACQQMDSLPHADIATHTCENLAEQRASLALLETAKSVGGIVHRTSAAELRARQDSRLPPLNTSVIPVSNARGSEILWRPTLSTPRSQSTKFVPHKVLVEGQQRAQEIEAVRGLVGL